MRPWYEIKFNPESGSYVTKIYSRKKKPRELLDGNSHSRHRYALSWAKARCDQLARPPF